MTRRLERKIVLIIEDEVDILNFASRVLELEGYCVLRTDNDEEALMMMRESRVDLILLDLRLPKHDGWAVLEKMKSDPSLSAIPVIVFSASAQVSQRDRAFSMGAADYLVKPQSAADLKQAVAHLLCPDR